MFRIILILSRQSFVTMSMTRIVLISNRYNYEDNETMLRNFRCFEVVQNVMTRVAKTISARAQSIQSKIRDRT